MSVINRMLSDLERRGAPAELHSDPAMVAEWQPARRRARTLLGRVFPLALATVLVAIAAALWYERGPRLMAALTAAGPPAATESAPAPPELVGLAFEGAAARPRLVLQLDRALGRGPRYSRSGGHATLTFDARASELSLPAPPSAQQVFRGMALEPAGDGRIRLRLEVDPEAGLDLRSAGDRVVLTGRMPQPEVTETARGTADQAAPGGNAETEASAGGESGAPAAAADRGGAAEGRATASSNGADAGAAPADGADDSGATEAASATEDSEAQASEQGGTGGEPVAQGGSDDQQAAQGGGQAEAAAPGGADAAVAQSVRKSQATSPEMRARRRYRDGRRALEAGKLSEARRLLDAALELDPGLHAARDLLVSLARRAGETDTARALLIDGVERAPERVRYAMPLARLLVDVGELERAAGVLARARATGAGNPGYHALTAAVAQRRDEHEQAAREYTRALELDAGNGLWWLGLGISLAASGHPGEARAALREARASGDLSEGLDRWAQGRIDELDGGREG